MKIYFARHGRTNYNDLELCNADPTVDVHITDTGIEQAETLAKDLKDVHLEHIFVSELKRTQQTAEIINHFHHIPIEVTSLLNDQRSGYESKPSRLFLEALDHVEDRWTAHFNDGESVEDMKRRVTAFLDQLKNKSYDTVLVVTSQWVIYAAIAIIRGISNEEAWKSSVEPGSCRELEV